MWFHLRTREQFMAANFGHGEKSASGENKLHIRFLFYLMGIFQQKKKKKIFQILPLNALYFLTIALTIFPPLAFKLLH